MRAKPVNFYDLDAWKSAHELTLQIYKCTTEFPDHEKFGLRSQIQRASSSISANVAEGFERYHFKDKIRFYYQARGSVAEVQNFLLLARDLGYIDNNICKTMGEQANAIRKLINGMIRSAETQLKK